MRENSVRFDWRDRGATREFQAGVSLHGHTMHSEECLDFLPRHLHQVPGLSQVVGYFEGARHQIDFRRAWWTPPLSPASAWSVESDQILKLNLTPFVSITDHDNIEAGHALGVTMDPDAAPLSVEWTVPYRRSIFHLGIHNIPRQEAADWMAAMTEYTAAPREEMLPAILDEFSRWPEALLVLNHPFWLEEGIEPTDHEVALPRILAECGPWLDALELNGTRPWKENGATIELGRTHRKPIVSGGDRHGCEPAACINLTNASTFAEFVAEVRGGAGTILFQPHYREPMAQRILETSRDILRTYPEYPDRKCWTDRVYYRGADGVARTLSRIWQGRAPLWLTGAAAAIRLAAGTGLRPAMRLLLAGPGELQQ